MKVGLALGGGGARGLAHLGVIGALLEADIPIHAIAGTSVGAVVGAAYCAGLPIKQIIAFAKTMRWHKLVKLCWARYGFLSFAPLEKLLPIIET